MPRPDPPSSLGNPVPPFRTTLTLPERLGAREGQVLDITVGGCAPAVDLAGLRNILVVKLDFIGDWVLTTPFLANLRKSAPGAMITAVVLDRVFDLAVACRFVDRVISVAPADHGPVRFAAASGEALDAFLADYRSGAFDLAIVPRWDTDFNGALRLANASCAAAVVGFSELCTERKRRDNRGDDRGYTTAFVDHSDVHEVEHNLALLEALGGVVTDRAVIVDMFERDRVAAAGFVRAHFGDVPRPLLAVAPFAAGRKQLPLDRSAEIARRLAGRLDMDVVVIGSPEHAPAAAAFARSVGPGAASAAGRLGLRQSAALTARAAALFGMDSSPGHIAAALGTPVAVVFANADDGSRRHVGAPRRFAPRGDPAWIRVIQPATSLLPCVDGCDADAPHCITMVDVDIVYRGLERFIGDAIRRDVRRGAPVPEATVP